MLVFWPFNRFTDSFQLKGTTVIALSAALTEVKCNQATVPRQRLRSTRMPR